METDKNFTNHLKYDLIVGDFVYDFKTAARKQARILREYQRSLDLYFERYADLIANDFVNNNTFEKKQEKACKVDWKKYGF